MIWSWLHRHPSLVDVSIVVLLLVTGIGAALDNASMAATAVTLVVAETLPLLVRRRYPVAVSVVVTVIALVMIALGVWLVPLQLGVALYTLTSLREARAARATAIASIVVVAVAVLAAGKLEFGAGAARVALLVAAFFLGDSIGSRRAYVREIEDPVAAAIAVHGSTPIVITEGNYLLSDHPDLTAARSLLDQVWFVEVDPEIRRRRLVERHIRFGKSPAVAADWVGRSDEANARAIRATRERADLVIRVQDDLLPPAPESTF